METPADACVFCGFVESEHREGGLTTCSSFEPTLRPRVNIPGRDGGDRTGRGAFQTYDPARDLIVLEVPTTDWTVAYRLIVQLGNLVVAEIRVYPTGPPEEGQPGEWTEDADRVPDGGLTARRLRQVGITAHRLHMGDILDAVQTAMGAEAFQAFMAERGLSDEHPEFLTTTSALSNDRTTRLAQVAWIYVAAIRAGASSPVAVVAERLDVPRTSARDQLHAARKLGLLGRPADGVAGGTLTSKARRILDDEMKEMER